MKKLLCIALVLSFTITMFCVPTLAQDECEHSYVNVGTYDKSENPNPKRNKIAYTMYICEKCGSCYREWLTGEGTMANFQRYEYVETVFDGDENHWTVEKWQKVAYTPEDEEYTKEFYRFRTQREGDYVGESDGITAPYDVQLYFGAKAFASFMTDIPLADLSSGFAQLTTSFEFDQFPYIDNLRLEKDGDVYLTVVDVYWTMDGVRCKYTWKHIAETKYLDQTTNKQLYQYRIIIGQENYPTLWGNTAMGTYTLRESDIERLEETPDFIIGDVNGDNTVDGRDLIRIRKYLASFDPVSGSADCDICPGADVNEDGTVNGKDLIALRKILLEQQ